MDAFVDHFPATEIAPLGDFGETYWRRLGRTEASLSPILSEQVGDADIRMLVDNLPSLCWMANSDGYIVWYNKRWHDYCGTTPKDMEGWGWASVHDPLQLPVVIDRWTASITSGLPFEMTFPLKGADGVFRPFLTRIVPLMDGDGRLSRWFGNNVEIQGHVSA